MIEQLNILPDNVLGFVCRGRVTRADYDTVLVPGVEAALGRHAHIRLYYETAPDFDGIDAGALWEDFKVGMGHLSRWERIAVVTDVAWIRQTVGLMAFLLPAVTRTFPVSEAAEGRAWIVASD